MEVHIWFNRKEKKQVEWESIHMILGLGLPDIIATVLNTSGKINEMRFLDAGPNDLCDDLCIKIFAYNNYADNEYNRLANEIRRQVIYLLDRWEKVSVAVAINVSKGGFAH